MACFDVYKNLVINCVLFYRSLTGLEANIAY